VFEMKELRNKISIKNDQENIHVSVSVNKLEITKLNKEDFSKIAFWHETLPCDGDPESTDHN